MDYHEATKHSELSIRESGHLLDWGNRPSPFKVYKNLKAIPLPRDFLLPNEESLKAIGRIHPKVEGSVDLHALAQLLFFSAGLTRVVKFNSGSYYMRAASATGALYPIELYVVCGNISDLKAGVYHFNPLDFTLVQLRDGDYRGELGAMSDDSVLTAPVTVVLTSLALRNAWKYGARSYRHWFWDSGVIVANLLATGVSAGLKCGLIMGFVDSEVDRLLCLSERKEATVALAPVGLGLAGSHAKEIRQISRLSPEVDPVSTEEVEYPMIWETHEASSLTSKDEVKNWVQNKLTFPESLVVGNKIPLRSEKDRIEVPSLGEVILRRGSSRRFARLPISFEQLSTIIDTSSSAVPLDYLKPGETLIDIYLIANEVQGLQSGAYFYNVRGGCLEQLKAGRFWRISGYLCLEQLLFSDASAVFYLMTNLKSVIDALGNRGYRAAQFEAGVIAGKIYLSAYSVSMGASGSTFYDDAVTEFFSPHAKGKSTMIAVGVGIPAYRARAGRVLPHFQNH
ncbi:MAG TPA: SagB/ThcOx family dehydrogenase [Nitrososphaerales archaeon]|nr:SagB/ThcOx family dehydrogenase [Nitrososphaerales archaeon]